MTTALNARRLPRSRPSQDPHHLDGQLYQLDRLGIPKGSAKEKRCARLYPVATAAAPLAEEARWLPYGPARRSAIRLWPHPETQEEMRRAICDRAGNFARALCHRPRYGGPRTARRREAPLGGLAQIVIRRRRPMNRHVC